jgi:hypothetical protein
MDVATLGEIFRTSFDGVKIADDQLLRELFARSDVAALRDIPSQPRAFRLVLKTIAPDLLALGVSVKVFDSGMVHISSATAAQKEASADAALRASFFSALPEAKALRKEFGNSDEGFQRFAAYRRGLNAGQIHPPRRGRIAAEDQGAAQVDSRLPLEKQCRKRWDVEPDLRSEFRNNFDSFLAYEKATANGQVRRLARRA